MWKKDEVKSQGTPDVSSVFGGFATPPSSDSSNSFPGVPRGTASISQGIRIKGEVTGTEDLFVDGFVEGKLNLTANCCLTVECGPRLAGSTGEVQTNRLAIEDGATLRGKVEAGKLEMTKPVENKTAAAAAAASTTTKPSAQPPSLGSETAAD